MCENEILLNFIPCVITEISCHKYRCILYVESVKSGLAHAHDASYIEHSANTLRFTLKYMIRVPFCREIKGYKNNIL